MKRVIYVVILLAIAGAFYLYAYPRLAGGSTADAQQVADTGGNAPGGTPAAGQRSGGQGQRGGSRAGGPGGSATAVVTAVAQQQTLPITNSAVGFVEPAATVTVRSRADGVVVAQNVTEGQQVKAGDVLFKLDDRATQALIGKDQAQIAKDQANADAAQAALTREQDLVKKAVDPQSTLDVDVAAAKAAQATVTVDQAQLRADQVTLSYMTITAPIDGRVGTVNTSVGNIVHASDTSTGGLLMITQMSPLRVSFSIPESDLDSFRNALGQGKPLPVKVLAPGDATPRETGTLGFIDSSVDTTSGTIVLKADVNNADGRLWPGQYVTAVTQVGAYTNATTIPLQAIQQSDAGAFVYAVDTDHKVKKTPVTTIGTVGETAVVGPQLKPGDHVVIEGQLRLADGDTARETVQGQGGGVASNGAVPGTPGAGTGQSHRKAGGAGQSAPGGTTDSAAPAAAAGTTPDAATAAPAANS